VSCGSAGNCAAVGYHADSANNQFPLVFDEVNGTWGQPQVISSTASLAPGNTHVALWSPPAVSCASAGNCVIGGTMIDVTAANPNADNEIGFVVSESTNGTWGSAQSLGNAAQVAAVTCLRVGDCTVTGEASGGAFTADEVSGSWGAVQTLTTPTGLSLQPSSVACSSPGNCAIVGDLIDPQTSHSEAAVATEANGSWGAATPLPGINANWGSAGLVSCGGDDACSAVGRYYDTTASGAIGTAHEFIADEVGGTWGSAHAVPGVSSGNQAPAINALSCAAPGYCSAGGDNGGVKFTTFAKALVVGEATGSTVTLKASTPTLTYGDEQTGQLSATVSGAVATPTGTVTVKNAAGGTVCTITLTAGGGRCTPAATALAVGSNHLAAYYNGDLNFATATSAALPVTVAKANAYPRLTLSAGSVRYGQENSEHLTVRVAPQYHGIPTGTVTVKAGSVSICTIFLKSGTGSCTLSATKLKVGSYLLTATYSGSSSYNAASSPRVALKVTS
jgi:hypothetical protein